MFNLNLFYSRLHLTNVFQRIRQRSSEIGTSRLLKGTSRRHSETHGFMEQFREIWIDIIWH